MVTSSRYQEGLDSLFKPFGISTPQYNVLRILRGQKGRSINLMDIQQRMIHKNSNATRLVEKLRLKGLVKRLTCEQNRRKVEISITTMGSELLERLDPLVEAYVRQWRQRISENEAQTLSSLLEKLR